MKTILYILQKEFIQVFRDKAMLPIIFIIPAIQLLVLSYAVTFEIKTIRFVIVDQDNSSLSQKLGAKFEGSSFFSKTGQTDNYEEAEQLIKNNKTDQILLIPRGFEKKLIKEKTAQVQVVTNSINGSAAGLMNAYAVSTINDFNKEIIIQQSPLSITAMPISIVPAFWYNPEMDYITYMVPGILVLLVTIIGAFLSSMNIVKEKEIGTIEQLNVTPIKKYQLIAGKLIPFWIIANVDLGIGLLLAWFVFHIPVVGSLALLYLVASVYLIVVLSFGLLISTLTNTMQQAMFISWFFLVVFIMMSGLFTPIESMPDWAQIINKFNPVAYFIRINRMIMLKGSGFFDIQNDFFLLLAYALAMIVFSNWRYRKTA